MTNSNSNTFSKTLIATLSILLLTGFSAAATSNLQVNTGQPVQPGDNVEVQFDTASNTDYQIGIDPDGNELESGEVVTTYTEESGGTADVTKTITPSNADGVTSSTDATYDLVVVEDSTTAPFTYTDSDDVDLQIDGVSPSINSVDITSSSDSGDSTFKNGETVQVTVTYDESVTVSNSPALNLGSNVAGDADYASSPSSGSDVVFEYTVQSGDEGSLTLGDISGGTIEDDAGNSADKTTSSNSITGDVDGTLPQNPSSTSITTDPIYSDNQNSVDVNVNFDSQPESGEVTVQLSDGSTSVEASSNAETSSTTTTVSGIGASSLSDGQITATAKIVDDAGNENTNGFTASSTVNKDTQIDTASITSPTDVTKKSGDTVTVDYNAQDSNFQSATVKIDNGPDSQIDSESISEGDSQVDLSIPSSTADGTYDVAMTVSDTAGNSKTVRNDGAVTVDDKVTALSIDDTTVTSGDSITVTGTADNTDDVSFEVSDSDSNTATYTKTIENTDFSVTLDLSGNSFSEGQATLNAEQASTYSSAEKSTTFTIDDTAPSLSSPSPTGAVSDNTSAFDVTLEDTDASIETAGLDESSISVTVTDSDTSDNEELLNKGTGNQHVDYYSSNNSLEVTGLEYADGQVTVSVDADDNAGNSVTDYSSSFTVDTQKPTIDSIASISSPTNSNTPSFDINLNGVNDGSNGLSQVDTSNTEVTVSDSDGNSYTYNNFGGSALSVTNNIITVSVQDSLADGSINVTVDAQDNAGNSNSDKVQDAFTVDTDNPAVSSISVSPVNISEDDIGEGNEAKVTVDFDEAMNENTGDVSVDPAQETLSTNPTVDNKNWVNSTRFTADIQFADNNEEKSDIKLDVTGAKDLAGNTISEASTTYDVDTIAPDVTEDSFPSYLSGSEDVTSYFSPSTGDGETTSYEYDTGDGFNLVKESNEESFDTTEFSDGTTIKFKATTTDDVGNTATLETGAITVDNTAPTVQGLDTSLTNNNQPTVMVSVKESTTSVADTTKIAVDDADGEVINDTISAIGSEASIDGENNITLNFADLSKTLADGEVNVTVTAKDKAGNSASPVKNSFTVDTGIPSVSSIEVVDRDRDGNVDAANVTFSEAVDDSSLVATNWEIKDTQVDSKNTGSTEDDSSVQLRLELDNSEISGTAVQDVTTESGPSVKDLAGNTLTSVGTDTVSEKDEADPVVHYSNGTNLVSFPSKVGVYDLDTLLSDSDNTSAVWRYNDGEWESYKPDRSSDKNEFDTVEGGQGYILEASGSGKIVADVDQEKSEFQPSGVSLDKSRWNLVGHYEETSGTVDPINGLSNGAGEQVVSLNPFTQVTTVEPGKAYWVETSEDDLYAPAQ